MKVNGQAVRVLRTHRGINLRALASDVGISAPYLSRIERGLKGSRGVDGGIVQRLADALSVPVEAIAVANEREAA